METVDNFEGDMDVCTTADGGDVTIQDGLFVCDRGFRTAIYLSLFGGNESDDGKNTANKSWWGNMISGTKLAEKYVSRFQNIITSLPMSTKNIKLAEDAALIDLDWIKTEGIADLIESSGSVSGKNIFCLIVRLKKKGILLFENEYRLNWEAVQNGVRK